MTPEDHATEARRLIEHIVELMRKDAAVATAGGDVSRTHFAITSGTALAQVHATLASAGDAEAARVLAQVRQLAENWDEQEDGPDAADFLERLRPLLGLPNPN